MPDRNDIRTAIYGYVYIGRIGNPPRCKIGISVSPTHRKATLESSIGERFSDWQVFHVYAPVACERHLHERYASNHVQGEWFTDDYSLYYHFCEYMRDRVTPCHAIPHPPLLGHKSVPHG